MAMTERKVAVVLIHGIGDQMPMETLRGFVEAVLAKEDAPGGDETISPAETGQRPEGGPTAAAHAPAGPPKGKDFPLYWSKPDALSGSYELRRFNAPAGKRRAPIDFYEYYWAHLMEGNALSHSLQWLNNLLFRSPATVPPKLRFLWFCSWVLVLAILALTALFWNATPVGMLAAAGTLLLIGAKLVAGLAMRDWIGDAARYFNAKPSNVNVRNAIRKGGVELLQKIHQSGEYKRVIVVGHSLGSAIALDILYYYWTVASVRHGAPDVPLKAAVEAIERAIRLTGPLRPEDWKALQKSVWQEIRQNGTPWRITDLITLGSPLTHLPFLTGLDGARFDARLQQRELPKCPPILDGKGIAYFTHYQTSAGNRRSIATLHHAACFAATRWTNIYFPHDGRFGGDPVGGPLRQLFGQAVEDRVVETRHWRGTLNHLDYWRHDPRDTKAETAPLSVLKAALNLGERLGSRSASPAPAKAVPDAPGQED